MKEYFSHYQLELLRPWDSHAFYDTLIKYDYIITKDDHNGLMIHNMMYRGGIALRSFVWVPQQKKFKELWVNNNYHVLIKYLIEDTNLIEFALIDKMELDREFTNYEGSHVAWLELKIEKNE